MKCLKSTVRAGLLTLAMLVGGVASAAGTLSVDQLPKVTSVVAIEGGRLYAATESGLYTSQDGGQSWQDSGEFRLPITLLARQEGRLYAFVVGKGLLVQRPGADGWEVLNNQFGAQVLQQLSVTADGMYGVNQFGSILYSSDRGKQWRRLWPQKELDAAQQRGKALFAANCQKCHGIEGVGETYSLQALTTKGYLMAPPLNDFTHAWHHTDDQLVKTILEGSPRKSRMEGWKGRLSEQQARDVVAYIKTLWGPRALACQGPKHMQCN